MKKLLQLALLCAVSIALTGCFLFSSSGTSSQTTTQKNIQLLTGRSWNYQQGYKVADGQHYDYKSDANKWIQFNYDGSCYENGFLGTNGRQKLSWSLNGFKLTIKGQNLIFGDGNLSGNEVIYNIVAISSSDLHLSRADGKKPNGSSITRHLVFKR